LGLREYPVGAIQHEGGIIKAVAQGARDLLALGDADGKALGFLVLHLARPIAVEREAGGGRGRGK